MLLTAKSTNFRRHFPMICPAALEGSESLVLARKTRQHVGHPFTKNRWENGNLIHKHVIFMGFIADLW